MGRRFLFIICLLTALSSGSAVYAQSGDTPKVEISTEKVSVNGSVFYVHKVLPQQTLYSISKAYGVNLKSITEVNPSLSSGLKAGSLLFIPVTTESTASTETPEEIRGDQNGNLVDNVSENVVVNDGNDQTIANESDNYIVHRVKWYETVTLIAYNYGVQPQEILALNNVSSDNWRKLSTLKIPVKAKEYAENRDDDTASENTAAADSTGKGSDVDGWMNISDSNNRSAGRDGGIYDAKNNIKLALVLPFGSKSSNRSTNNIDFYCGALMALHTQQQKGMSIELKVVDLSDWGSAESALKSNTLSDCDIIIGPVATDEIRPFAQFGMENGIPAVSPLDHKADTLAYGNPYFFQMPTSAGFTVRNMVRSLNPKPGEKVTVIYDASGEDSSFLKEITSALENEGIDYTCFKYGIQKGRTITSSMKSHLNSSVCNKVILASETDAFAADALRNLKLIKVAKVPVQLFCSHKLRNSGAIDAGDLYYLNAHFCAPYYINYKSEDTKDFVRQYRALFSTEPSQHAFHGYDTFTFFISALNRLGSGFISGITEFEMDMLQNCIRFEKIGEEDGYRNVGTKNIIWNPDYSITEE